MGTKMYTFSFAQPKAKLYISRNFSAKAQEDQFRDSIKQVIHDSQQLHFLLLKKLRNKYTIVIIVEEFYLFYNSFHQIKVRT